MNRAERRRRTEVVRAHRIATYAQRWSWRDWTNAEALAQWYITHYWRWDAEEVQGFIDRDLARKRQREGQMREKLIYNICRERDWYTAGLEKKMRIADYDMAAWLDEVGISNDYRPRGRERYFA